MNTISLNSSRILIGNTFLAALILFLLSGLSSAAGQDNLSMVMDKPASDEVIAGTMASTPQQNLDGIWSVSLNATELVVMTVHQKNGRILGSAKSETAVLPWNAVIDGSISDSELNLMVISIQGSSIVLTEL
jgi:hypothetical protein